MTRSLPAHTCHKTRDHMIIYSAHYEGYIGDWEYPHKRTFRKPEEFLTPEESRWLPVHQFKLKNYYLEERIQSCQTRRSFLTFSFPATKISKHFTKMREISYFFHLGMRTFAMGTSTHNRLGAGSRPVKNLSTDILKVIGKFAGGY